MPRYALQELGSDENKFWWVAPDQSATLTQPEGTTIDEVDNRPRMTIAKGQLSHWVNQGGIEYARAKALAALQLAFDPFEQEGNNYINFEEDGTPIEYWQEQPG